MSSKSRKDPTTTAHSDRNHVEKTFVKRTHDSLNVPLGIEIRMKKKKNNQITR